MRWYLPVSFYQAKQDLVLQRGGFFIFSMQTLYNKYIIEFFKPRIKYTFTKFGHEWYIIFMHAHSIHSTDSKADHVSMHVLYNVIEIVLFHLYVQDTHRRLVHPSGMGGLAPLQCYSQYRCKCLHHLESALTPYHHLPTGLCLYSRLM